MKTARCLSFCTTLTQRSTVALLLAAGLLTALTVGCGGEREQLRVRPADEVDMDLYAQIMEGTVGSMAYRDGGGAQPIRGYGLVVGLAGKGSSEVPDQIRKQLIQEMGRMGVGDPSSNSNMLAPDRLIDDPDTAVVAVSGVIHAGMPTGARFDIQVSALPGSQATSLDGGTLFRTDLRTFIVSGPDLRESLPVAWARGEILVNPSVEPNTSAQVRRGVIPGAGVLIENRRVWLTLPRPDYALAHLLQEQINSRFPSFPATAVARDPTMVEINIPRQWQNDYGHFLNLLEHLYIRRGGAYLDMKMRSLVDAMLQPDSPAEDIALIWEAMDRQVLPVIAPLLTNADPTARFYAARTGARLEDAASIDVLIQISAQADTPHRLAAIAELGRCGTLGCIDALKNCFNADDDLVRIAALHAMLDSGLVRGIEQQRINDSFDLYVVPTTASPFIYATRSGQAAIAVFGEDMLIRRPVFFSHPDGVVTINSTEHTGKIGIYRRIGGEGKLSDVLECDYDVPSVIAMLGGSPEPGPDGAIRGLGLTYSQVVSTLFRLCQGGVASKIPAEFVLQKPILPGTISTIKPSGGRQNTAAE